MPDTPEELDLAIVPLQDIFRYAWDVRGSDWLDLGRRNLLPMVPEHVKENAKKVPVRMPIMVDNINADVMIMTQNEPEILVLDQEGTQDSKADAEDMRLYFDVQRSRLNHGGRIDKALATHMVWPDGVALLRLDARKPTEYDGEEEGKDYDSAREKHLRAQEAETFSLKVIDPKTCAWWPLENPRAIVEDVEVDLAECKLLHRREDGVSAAEILGLVKNTPGVPHENQGSQTTSPNQGSVAHFVAYEYEDDDGDWWRCEYVYPYKGNLQKDGEFLGKSKLPHKGSSYEVVPGGATNWSEQTDPHWRYRPKLESLGVMVERLNTLLTLEQACVYSQLSDRGIYLSIPAQGLNDDARRVMGMLFPQWETAEGTSADEILVGPLPTRKEGEVLLQPGVLRSFPGFVPTLQATSQMIDKTERWVEKYSTNPFLTGTAYAEYREGTGTAASLGTQNSASVYGPYREQIDAAWTRIFRKMANCMITWGEENEGKPLRYYATTSDESNGAGKVVWVDAKKAARNYVIKLRTLVEMQQERLIRLQEKEHLYQVGRLGFEDLLKEEGWPDPHRKAIELAEEGNLYKLQVENEAIMQARRQVLIQQILGLNLQAIGEQAAALAQPAGAAGTAPPVETGAPGGAETPLPRIDRRPGGAPALGLPPVSAGGI